MYSLNHAPTYICILLRNNKMETVLFILRSSMYVPCTCFHFTTSNHSVIISLFLLISHIFEWPYQYTVKDPLSFTYICLSSIGKPKPNQIYVTL